MLTAVLLTTSEMYLTQIKANVDAIKDCFFVGFFYSFKLFWIFVILALYKILKTKQFQYVTWALIYLVGVLGQLLLASDTSRLIGLAFPIILFSFIYLSKTWNENKFNKLTLAIIVLNLLIPQYYVGQSTMIRFYSLPASLILKYFYGIETWVG
jgi:hypothetical protein